MIGSTLYFVANRLDEIIRQRLHLTPSEKKLILSPFVDLNGGVAIHEENTLVMFPVNIQKESVIANPPARPSFGAGVVDQPPPLHLNLFLVIGVYYEAAQLRYGLDLLTTAISILQGQPLWDHQNTPGLPDGLQKLIFEMESLDFHQQSHIWGHLGGKYLPSVVYKLRMIIIDDGAVQAVTPSVSQIQTTGGAK